MFTLKACPYTYRHPVAKFLKNVKIKAFATSKRYDVSLSFRQFYPGDIMDGTKVKKGYEIQKLRDSHDYFWDVC